MNLKWRVNHVFLLSILFLAVFPTLEFAKLKPLYIYHNMFYGARSIGLGNAFTAVADDLTAVYRNPAGVAEQSGPSVFVSYRKDSLDYSFPSQTDSTATPVQQYDFSMNSSLKNFDFFSIAAPVIIWDIKWNFALSYYRYNPYGFSGQSLGSLITDNDGSTADTTVFDFQGSGGIDVLAFTGAFYLTDYLSFGITLQQFFNSGDINYTQTSSALSYSRNYSEKIDNRNLVLGLMVKFTKKIIFGFSLNTQFSTDFVSQNTYQVTGSGTSSDFSTTATLKIPNKINLGLLLKPYTWMNFSIDYSKQYWSKSTLTNYYNSTAELQYPVRDDYTFTQNDTSDLRMGIQFEMPLPKATVYLRGGYFNDQQLFTSNADAKVKLVGYSFGLGAKISQRINVDLAYMRQKSNWDEVAYFDSSAVVRSTMVNKVIALSFSFDFSRKEI